STASIAPSASGGPASTPTNPMPQSTTSTTAGPDGATCQSCLKADPTGPSKSPKTTPRNGMPPEPQSSLMEERTERPQSGDDPRSEDTTSPSTRSTDRRQAKPIANRRKVWPAARLSLDRNPDPRSRGSSREKSFREVTETPCITDLA